MSAKQPELLNLYHAATDHSPLPLVAVEGLTHLVCYANPAFCRLAGKENVELLGRPFAKAVQEGGENGCGLLLDRVYLTGEAETLMEQAHAHDTPHPVYWSYAAWAVLDEEKHPVGVMFQVTDTTDTALFRRQMLAMNEALLVSDVQQHELTDVAERLNFRLQRAMQETNHRVKNNLQVITSLADMQIEGDSPTVPVAALQRIISHTHTLALLHDLLAQQGKVTTEQDILSTDIAFDYLMPFLQNSIGMRHLHSDIAPMTISLSKSAALSLLVCELVSNAVKHGAGNISVILKREGDKARLTVCDEGSGFPPDFDPRTSANIGMELIHSFAGHDMRGNIEFSNRSEGGACITVTFPLSAESDIPQELSERSSAE